MLALLMFPRLRSPLLMSPLLRSPRLKLPWLRSPRLTLAWPKPADLFPTAGRPPPPARPIPPPPPPLASPTLNHTLIVSRKIETTIIFRMVPFFLTNSFLQSTRLETCKQWLGGFAFIFSSLENCDGGRLKSIRDSRTVIQFATAHVLKCNTITWR